MRKLTRAESGREMQIGRNDWNTVCETVERVNAADGASVTEDTAAPNRLGQVVVRHRLSETVPAFGVLAADRALYPDRSLDRQIRFAFNAGIEITGKHPTGASGELPCIVQETLPPRTLGDGIVFGPTCVRVNVTNRTHTCARTVPGNSDHLESADSGPVRLLVPAPRLGLQICYGILGLSVSTASEPLVHAKELFPAVVYRRAPGETFLICPGGKGPTSSLNTVHVLHVEERKISTAMFGSLPVPMSNFDAALADNGYGGSVLVCAPGEVDEGSKFPVQRYDFAQELWSKSDQAQSLAGCPVYERDGQVIVAGGQAAYHSAGPTQNAVSGTFGFTITPFWTIDPVTGAVATRVPLRKTAEFFSAQSESHIVNQQKRFLKQNFDGIAVNRGGAEFVAVGGTEMLGYRPEAVVTYALNSTGPLVDCQNATVRLGECEIFPDTPVPLGECRAVRVRRRRSGNMIVSGDWLVAVGGRYRDAGGTFVYHKRPWSLDLDNTAEGWRDDLFPDIPTPRINAALSGVVTMQENDAAVERVFLIGGRTSTGLIASIEALNLTTGAWETDWPGLDGRQRAAAAQ